MPFHAEKHDEALASLRSEGVRPERINHRLLCREAVADVVAGESVAAVISDYAIGLLQDAEVTRGERLQVIDRTQSIPYITVFSTPQITIPSMEDDQSRPLLARLSVDRK